MDLLELNDLLNVSSVDYDYTCTSDGVRVQIEADDFAGTIINCTCLSTGATRSYTYLSGDLDRYRYDDNTNEIKPIHFVTHIAPAASREFLAEVA